MREINRIDGRFAGLHIPLRMILGVLGIARVVRSATGDADHGTYQDNEPRDLDLVLLGILSVEKRIIGLAAGAADADSAQDLSSMDEGILR